MNDFEQIKDTRFAKIAYYVSYIPVIGILLFILFGFLSLLRITYRGRSGFILLGKAVKVLLAVNITYFTLNYYSKNFYFLGERKYKYECNYDKSMEKTTEFYPSGRIWIEKTRKNDKYSRIVYYENGQLAGIRNYIETTDDALNRRTYWEANGGFGRNYLIHGTSASYYKNGKLGWLADFQNGVPKGPMRCYDEKGNLEREQEFAIMNGKLICIRDLEYKDGKTVVTPEK